MQQYWPLFSGLFSSTSQIDPCRKPTEQLMMALTLLACLLYTRPMHAYTPELSLRQSPRSSWHLTCTRARSTAQSIMRMNVSLTCLTWIIFLKLRPHQQQCRSNVRLCRSNIRLCLPKTATMSNELIVKFCPFDKVERCFDINAVFGNNVERGFREMSSFWSSVVCLCACLSAAHVREPCKNGWTDRDAVLGTDLRGSKDQCRTNPCAPASGDKSAMRPICEITLDTCQIFGTIT